MGVIFWSLLGAFIFAYPVVGIAVLYLTIPVNGFLLEGFGDFGLSWKLVKAFILIVATAGIFLRRPQELNRLPLRGHLAAMLLWTLVAAMSAPQLDVGVSVVRNLFQYIAFYYIGASGFLRGQSLRNVLVVALVGVVAAVAEHISIGAKASFMPTAAEARHLLMYMSAPKGVTMMGSAVMYSATFALCLALCIYVEKRLVRYAALAIAGVLLLGSMLTFTRATLVGIMVVMAAVGFMAGRRRGWYSRKDRLQVFRYGIALTAAIGIIGVIYPAAQERALTTLEVGLSGRMGWLETAGTLPWNPVNLLIGFGLGQVGYAGGTYLGRVVVDNMYFEVFATMGTIGFALQLSLFLRILKKLWLKAVGVRGVNGALVAAAFGAWCSVLVVMLSGGSAFDYPGAMVLWLMTGIALRRDPEAITSGDRTPGVRHGRVGMPALRFQA